MNKVPSWLVALCFSLCISAGAAQLTVGDAVPSITAKDQFGNDYTFTNGTRLLLVATEMGCAKAANHKLAEQGVGFLEHHQAAYLMDIHTMPAVARFFALPKMRKYPERIVLIESAVILEAFPVRSGHVTVLALTAAGHILKISYWNPDNDAATGCFE